MSSGEAPHVDGICDERFASVRDAFAENFVSRDEVGAAVCMSVDGITVVDLWGGLADPTTNQPWQRDTLVNVFSVGKGLSALCVARLTGEGRIDPDERVATYWPEFAAAGKGDVTVAHLLTHQAGLPSLRKPMPDGAMFDWDLMTDSLAAQEPWWEPGTAIGYHVNTFGFLVGEVVRRVAGRSLGTYLRDEIAGPLDADVHIGLHASHDHRVATMGWGEHVLPSPDIATLDDAQLMVYNAYANPVGLSGTGILGTRAWRGAEIPSTNGHGTARGVARIYTALVTGELVGGGPLADADALARATTIHARGEDVVLFRSACFGLGFQVTNDARQIGPNPRTYGHFGAGGSLGFADPDAGIGFGYVMNQMGPRWQNPRNRAVIDALYECL